MKAIAEALNTLARQSSGYAQELAFLKVPWPLPEVRFDDCEGFSLQAIFKEILRHDNSCSLMICSSNPNPASHLGIETAMHRHHQASRFVLSKSIVQTRCLLIAGQKGKRSGVRFGENGAQSARTAETAGERDIEDSESRLHANPRPSGEHTGRREAGQSPSGKAGQTPSTW